MLSNNTILHIFHKPTPSHDRLLVQLSSVHCTNIHIQQNIRAEQSFMHNSQFQSLLALCTDELLGRVEVIQNVLKSKLWQAYVVTLLSCSLGFWNYCIWDLILKYNVFGLYDISAQCLKSEDVHGLISKSYTVQKPSLISFFLPEIRSDIWKSLNAISFRCSQKVTKAMGLLLLHYITTALIHLSRGTKCSRHSKLSF